MNPSLPTYRGRFALLWHELPQNSWQLSHWDLLLELDNGQLAAWRLPGVPLAELSRTDSMFTAERLPDHRFAYLDYEGPVSGDRGWVKRKAGGAYLAMVLHNNHLAPSKVEVLDLIKASSVQLPVLPSDFDRWTISTPPRQAGQIQLTECEFANAEIDLLIAIGIDTDSLLMIRFPATPPGFQVNMTVLSNGSMLGQP